MVMKNKQLSMKSKKMVFPGGSGKMMKGQASNAQKPGVSSQEHSRSKTKGPVKGGSTKMAGKGSAKPAKPA